jgi:pimeloyl-ACP methyl ester carboxylesterase
VPVLSIASDPSGGLAARQRYLLAELARVDQLLGGIRAIHLVGHSTGGLDAELLCRAAPCAADATWKELDPHQTRRRLGSITTISTPHYGTHLVEAEVVASLREPWKHPKGLPEAGGLALDLVKLLGERCLTFEALEGAAQSGLTTAQFVARFFYRQDLARDLRPVAVEALRASNPREVLAPVASVVVVAPRQSVADGSGGRRRPDALFQRLRALTADTGGEASEAVRQALLRINADRYLAIRNPGVHLDELDPTDSDGVVNAGRQLLLPSRGDDAFLAGLVVADHADVIGHYDRKDPLSFDWRGESRSINTGFFRSGAGFGDDQFFKLYARVAECIADAADRPMRPAQNYQAALLPRAGDVEEQRP